jgi:hypothetical protein
LLLVRTAAIVAPVTMGWVSKTGTRHFRMAAMEPISG